nr:hypothetical protein [Mycobacterium leprae]
MIPAHTVESAKVAVMGYDARAMFDGKRYQDQVGIVDEVTASSQLHQNFYQESGVAHS